jgi:hypothetical protein
MKFPRRRNDKNDGPSKPLDAAEAGRLMELNRNQIFLTGIVLVLLGAQFRWVESFVLNEKTTQIVAERMQQSQQGTSPGPLKTALISSAPAARRTVTPPRWLGLSLISIGSVLILQSLAMRRPG